MVHSGVFGLLVITLCLVACLSAHAAVSKEDAQEAVDNVKKLTDKALEEAQTLYNSAEGVKETVDSRKVKAEDAENEAKTAAQGNAKATLIATKAKSVLDELLEIYLSAKNKAQEAVDYTKDLRSKARVLVGKSKIQITPDEGSPENYSKVIESAADVTKEVQQLEAEIAKAKTLLSAASVEKFKVSDHAEKAQVAKHQVDSVVIIAKMETLLSEADDDIVSIQEKSDEIAAAVEEIKKHLDNTPQNLIHRINALLTNAEGDVRRVTTKMKEAGEAKQAMVKEKTNADNTLTTMESLTDENQVRKESRDVEHFAKRAEEELKKIKAALKDAEWYAQNSNNRKRDTEKALSQNNNKPKTEGSKETNKPDKLVQDVIKKATTADTTGTKDTNVDKLFQAVTTKPTSEDTNKQTKINPGQPLNDATTKPMTLGTSGQSYAKPSQPLQGAETNPTNEDTTGKNDTNTSEQLKDITTKPTSEDTKEEKETKTGQYATKSGNSTGTKGIISPYDTINDGAITASFSLLLALIACAALN